jgi:hypothetical protein
MVGLPREIAPIRNGLLKVGFRSERLRLALPIPGSDRKVDLLAYADQPFDSRTAAVAVIRGQRVEDADISALRSLGAPIVFASLPDHVEFWTQGATRPIFKRRIAVGNLPRFFQENITNLSPGAIYRAKIWGRLEHSFQLDFVDAGLMPLVEEEAGRKLKELIERVVAGTKKRLGWGAVSDSDGQWLLKSTFWLLAAKILKDKEVPQFTRLNLTSVEDVYQRLARHYNSESPRPVQVGGRARRVALAAAAEQIAEFAHCGSVSTEALGYLYESALIDRVTRSRLGTHSKPTWLVDYIVGRLRPWIEKDIPVADRRVFEPACGHGAFLISAMRLLTELLPADWPEPRRQYLRKRLHGLEIDPFALEIARLSLTLADVPNPNGWALTEGDMFQSGELDRDIRQSTIILANPPFENFDVKDRAGNWLGNKAAEVLARVVKHLPSRGVFGFVLPQTFLQSEQGADVRRSLLEEYEIAEISLFADKVFRYGESESAVVLGRRMGVGGHQSFPVRYCRIREGQIEEFRRSYQPGSLDNVNPDRFISSDSASIYLPDLYEVWDELESRRHLEQFASYAQIGKGLEYKSSEDSSLPAGAVTESPTPMDGISLAAGYSAWTESQMTHGLPEAVWLNLGDDVIRRPGLGTTAGKPQVLLNYARVSRQAWRLKALLDPTGHPVTSDFLVVRPMDKGPSLQALWAICNSPIGNAYAYCHSDKRHILARDIRRMPFPALPKSEFNALDKAVTDYFTDAKAIKRTVESKNLFGDPLEEEVQIDDATSERLKFLHWRIDAEVLRLYNLPAALERKVLDLFSGVSRRGVPFRQTEYFPPGFTDLERLSDLLAITVDWPKTNRRRAKLIDLEEEGRLTPRQAEELETLQRLADATVSFYRPVQLEDADKIIEHLRRGGLWKEQGGR